MWYSYSYCDWSIQTTQSIWKPGLMCDPSTSWSVIIMIWRYRSVLNSFSLSYFLVKSSPTAFRMSLISAFFFTPANVKSRTFSSFPRNGYIPKYLLAPEMDEMPASADDFAESPSVMIKVHFSASAVPALIRVRNSSCASFESTNHYTNLCFWCCDWSIWTMRTDDI